MPYFVLLRLPVNSSSSFVSNSPSFVFSISSFHSVGLKSGPFTLDESFQQFFNDRLSVHLLSASGLLSRMNIFFVLLGGSLLLLGAVAVQSIHTLFRNYLAASKIGLRFHVIPISHLNRFWMLLDKRVLRYVRKIFGESVFTRYNWMGWELHDRWYSHHELGDVFMLVTPGRNWLYIGHPDVLMEIARRRDDFPRCVELTQVLDVFGPSVGSVSLPCRFLYFPGIDDLLVIL